MDVYLSGGKVVRLNSNDLIGQGGEGAVYASGSLAYKIYHDPALILPPDKVRELAAIRDPRVVSPEDLLYNAKGKPIGYYMGLVEKGTTICEGMTPAFRARRRLGQDAYHKAVDELLAAIHSVHRAKVVLVDLNDLNVFLVPDSVRIIDLGSAQTPSYPATAVQALVRDPLASGPHFDEGSDWYAFAILAFELFCGAHPFCGTHPGIRTVAERMRQGASAFDPLVRLPGVVYPLSGIPAKYRSWMEAVLSNKSREAPGGSGIAVPVQVVQRAQPAPQAAAGSLSADVLFSFPQRILRTWGIGSHLVSLGEDGTVYADARRTGFKLPAGAPMVAGTSRQGSDHLFAGYLVGGEMRIYDLVAEREVQAVFAADEVANTGHMMIFRNQNSIYEVMPVGVSAGAKRIGNCMPRTTKLGDGAAIQVMLQTAILSALSEAGRTREIALPNLLGYKPLGVWAAGSVAVLRAAKGRRVDRIVVQVADDGTAQTFHTEDLGDDLDLARTSSGVVADRVGDLVRLWHEASPASVTTFNLPQGDVGPLASYQGIIVAPMGNQVVRLRSR